MAKRPLEDYSKVDLTVSDFTEVSPKAKVHCVVSSLSPMKESRGNSYFQGQNYILPHHSSPTTNFKFTKFISSLMNS